MRKAILNIAALFALTALLSTEALAQGPIGQLFTGFETVMFGTTAVVTETTVSATDSSIFVEFDIYNSTTPDTTRPSNSWSAADAFLAASPANLYRIEFEGVYDTGKPVRNKNVAGAPIRPAYEQTAFQEMCANFRAGLADRRYPGRGTKIAPSAHTTRRGIRVHRVPLTVNTHTSATTTVKDTVFVEQKPAEKPTHGHVRVHFAGPTAASVAGVKDADINAMFGNNWAKSGDLYGEVAKGSWFVGVNAHGYKEAMQAIYVVAGDTVAVYFDMQPIEKPAETPAPVAAEHKCQAPLDLEVIFADKRFGDLVEIAVDKRLAELEEQRGSSQTLVEQSEFEFKAMPWFKTDLLFDGLGASKAGLEGGYPVGNFDIGGWAGYKRYFMFQSTGSVHGGITARRDGSDVVLRNTTTYTPPVMGNALTRSFELNFTWHPWGRGKVVPKRPLVFNEQITEVQKTSKEK